MTRISPTEDLAECVQKIIKDYSKTLVVDDLYHLDQIRIRRRGPGSDDLKADDIVGTYLDDEFTSGKITKDTIRLDIQTWLQKQGKTV